MNLLIIRLIIFGALFWVGLRLWRIFNNNHNSATNDQIEQNKNTQESESNNAHPQTTTTQNTKKPQTIIPCALCGVHLPLNTAIQAPEGVFCSVEHLIKFKENN